MSERQDPNDSTTYTPRDAGSRPAHDGSPDHLSPSGTSGQTVGGPRVGGEPAMPGTSEYQHEVEHTKGNTPLGISAGLLWTAAILIIVVIVLLFIFN